MGDRPIRRRNGPCVSAWFRCRGHVEQDTWQGRSGIRNADGWGPNRDGKVEVESCGYIHIATEVVNASHPSPRREVSTCCYAAHVPTALRKTAVDGKVSGGRRGLKAYRD
jgi:hypothetical protein